jgi:hypothetical protein
LYETPKTIRQAAPSLRRNAKSCASRQNYPQGFEDGTEKQAAVATGIALELVGVGFAKKYPPAILCRQLHPQRKQFAELIVSNRTEFHQIVPARRTSSHWCPETPDVATIVAADAENPPCFTRPASGVSIL